MKKILPAFLMLTLLSMAPQKKQRVIFFGDSITQMGINEGGYITLIQEMLKEKKLDSNYELIGAGVGGNKIYDLYLRMEEDVLSKNPDVVIIYIGVNDVWHKTMGTGTDLDKFERFYRAIIKKLQEKNIRVILVTPAVIGEKNDGSNPEDKDLDIYSDVPKKLSEELNLTFIDLRKLFMDYEKENNKANAESGVLTTDRVHLNPKGNRMVADAMLKALMNR